MKPLRPSLTRKLIIPALCILAGGAAGFATHDLLLGEEGCRTFTEVREGGYRFISPLLECDSDREVSRNRELRPFRAKTEARLRGLLARGAVSDVAVYFRELNDGIWFAINERAKFEPASIRKLPMLIAILKQAERAPGLLSSKLVANLQQDHDALQNFKPSTPLALGRSYSVGELLTRMIVQSDNNAFMLLSSIVDTEELGKVYGLLAMRPPSEAAGESRFSVLTYGAFFRILYNGTYLSKEMSDLALEQLARAEFRAGLVAGVPDGVPVAHKFGERSGDAGEGMQLHDCGIVYYPRHPYLLCVMAKGPSFEELAGAIAAISRGVYDELEGQQPR